MEATQIITILLSVLYLLERLANWKLLEENKRLRKLIQVIRESKVKGC